ncbi:polyketide synthase [Dactylonectria macrodidyma]|uniref:Polyketide synthase n=1 Tax=Dactylonectria macrodidyma TaxID=307937 RepID=A0A9P9D960_9HYPO|nr:polyketide synthase [Dactylonectria macrodidyma]
MSVISAVDRQMLVDEYNKTDDAAMLGHCVHQLIERSADRHSERTALICGTAELTYRDLNARANRLARVLVQRGVKPGDLVGVALERSVDLVVALLAVLKTGSAYVPIDPTFPEMRIGQMMDDAGPSLIVAGTSTLDAVSLWKDVCLKIDEALDSSNNNNNNTSSSADSGNLLMDVRSEDLAYIMYTSGSTGKPKGVEMSHGSLSNLLLSSKRDLRCDKADRMLAVTTISFDMAFMELFLPLLCGATAVIAQAAQVRDPRELVGLMERHGITMMQGTPVAWQMLLEAGWTGTPRLKTMLSAGDALSRRLAERLLDCGEVLWNLYGPTETTYATNWRVRRGEDMLIGVPNANGRLYVLDEALSPVALGSPGELYIGGASVARGYRNNEELTRSRFLANPFHAGRLYRTGDLACFPEPGKLSVLGRIDSQVKVRGYRIEAGDVEAAIIDHEYLSGAAVVSRDERLVAFCVRDTTEDASKAVLESVLRPWLAERLPAYMVPALFIELNALPISLNGKIDRKALPDLVAPAAPVAPVVASQQTTTKPDIGLENNVLAIWKQVLGHDSIGINDNFFEVGGDSVRVVRVTVELEKVLGRTVSPAVLFEHYTAKALAAYLASTNTNDPEPIRAHQSSANNEDIAIISMACRLPGDIATPEEYWELLKNGGDAIVDVPKDRWDADALYDADPDAVGKTHCRRGGFIAEIDSFDAPFFGISPREARALDPLQHLVLETCWEGFERAGYTMDRLRGSQTGVFIGTSGIPAHNSLNASATQNLADLDGYTVTGSAGGTLSGRVSYVLGLEGPAMTLDTACSSSLVTTHLACSALRQGECDMAVSGGVSLMLNPGLHVEFSGLRGMSPDGSCRAFAADTQGTGWGEGSSVVVLKRLSDAQRDGDKIHAVLRGTAVNHDGRSASLTAPSGPAQQRLIRSALGAAGLQPGDIDYIEAHGTGTKLGDPIEGTALADVFGGRPGAEPLWVGSAKSNLGHTQAAAGLVGMIKVVLAIRNSTLPQSLHVATPSPAVDWRRANMAVVQEKRPWVSRDDRLRRAGVSAFGIGGTNAHAIVEEPPCQVAECDAIKASVPPPPSVPFVLSGHTDAALRQQAEKLHRHISSSTNQDRLGDVAYSLATSRTHFRRRLALMAADKAELLEKLASIAQPSSFMLPANGQAGEPRLAMLFTGQGSQRLGIGKDLYETYPVFRDALDAVVAEFTELEAPLLDIMWAEPGSDAATLLNRTDFAQPALFAVEVALWRLWQSWSVQPECVLGHSVGELAAAHVAGILDLVDACKLVAARGRLMQALPGHGKMASLEASAVDVTAAIQELGHDGKVEVAGYNTPSQTVVSGDVEAVESVVANFTAQGCKAKTLDVSHAFHSHHMDGMLEAFRAVAENVKFNPPQFSVVSSLTGKLAEAGQLEQPGYWVQQARQAVRFSDSMQTLSSKGINVFLELGPRPVLCGMGAVCLADSLESTTWVPSLIPGKNDASVMQQKLADLHVRNVSVDWAGYFKPFACQRVELPTYAFQRERFGPAREVVNYTSNGKTQANSEPEVHGVGRFEFDINWREVDTKTFTPAGSWGLLCPAGDVSWASDIKTALSSANIQLLLVEDLKAAEELDGLLCLWDSDTDVISQSRDFTAAALSQLQAAAKTEFAPPLVWVTRRAVGAGPGDSATGLGAGPLWGLQRTARNEHPELHLRLIDLGEGEAAIETIAAALMLGAEPECALRQGRVLVPHMQRVEVRESGSDGQLLRQDGAVLVTGGLGDLGGRVARWLATAHGIRDLVLTSRRGMGAPGADALVVELAGLGAKAAVVAADMADFNSVKSIMAAFNDGRPLRGVVHAAGVVDSGVLSSLTPQRCAMTFAPKVDGAWNLHQLTRDMDLDLFLMFSSISGVMGLPGLGNYAAANTFQDALAHLRRAQGLPGTAVAYGTWEGGGMAAGLVDSTRAHLAEFGLDPLTQDQGLELFETTARSGRALTVAAALDPAHMQVYYEDRGGIPPLLRSLLVRITAREPRSWGLRKVLSEAAPDQHASIVLRMVRETVAKALGFAGPDDVPVDQPLQDIGIDSLTAVLMRNHLATLTGLTLSANIAMLHPNLKALSQSLLTQLQESWADSSSSASASGGDTPATTTLGAPCLNMAAIRKSCLDPGFTFDNVTRGPTACAARPESVLVTGGTGFVGAFVVHELLEMGIATYCLVRASTVDQARQRMVGALETYGLWKPEYEPLLNPVVGDLAQPMLGLSEEVFDDLADGVDAICHSGALVDWMRPLEDYVGPNIVSTHEVLRLASHGRGKTVHLVSTISTLPKHMGYDLTEEDREYGYATSKYMAERMIAAARWRGARASSYRLPFVSASSTNGRFRLDRGDFLHNLISGSLELGAFPELNGDLSVVLPVDYLCKSIVGVMTKDLHRIGHDFDFRNARAPSFSYFFKLFGAASGGKEIVPFSTWQQRALDYAVAHPTSALARITAVFDGYTDETAAAMVTGLPVGQHVFGGDDYPAPAVDENSVRKYLDCINAAQVEKIAVDGSCVEQAPGSAVETEKIAAIVNTDAVQVECS